MVINCNEINQVASELKMKFEAGARLDAEELDLLVELTLAARDCSGEVVSIDSTHYKQPLETIADLTNLNYLLLIDKQRHYVKAENVDYFWDSTATSGEEEPFDKGANPLGYWITSQSGGGNTFLPDEEDITLSNNMLKLRDRLYTSNSLGYNIIRSDFDFTNISSVYSNSIWEIREAFDLSGNTLIVPENVTIKFNGGKFSNGTITGDATKIDSGNQAIFDLDIIINGSWDLENNSIKWFGAIGDGVVDDTLAVQNFFNVLEGSTNLGNTEVNISKGDYVISSTIIPPSSLSYTTIKGVGARASRFIWKGSVGENMFYFKEPRHLEIENIGFFSTSGNKPLNALLFQKNQDEKVGSGSPLGVKVIRCTIGGDGNTAMTNGISFDTNFNDWNNEQSVIENCDFYNIEGRAIWYKHGNSLWHRSVFNYFKNCGYGLSNYVSGGSGGNFSSWGDKAAGGDIFYEIGESFHPVHIYNAEAEAIDSFIITPDELQPGISAHTGLYVYGASINCDNECIIWNSVAKTSQGILSIKNLTIESQYADSLVFEGTNDVLLENVVGIINLKYNGYTKITDCFGTSRNYGIPESDQIGGESYGQLPFPSENLGDGDIINNIVGYLTEGTNIHNGGVSINATTKPSISNLLVANADRITTIIGGYIGQTIVVNLLGDSYIDNSDNIILQISNATSTYGQFKVVQNGMASLFCYNIENGTPQWTLQSWIDYDEVKLRHLIKAGDYNLERRDRTIFGTAGMTYTLNASPSVGDKVTIIHKSGDATVSPLTISGNGKLFTDLSSQKTISTQYGTLTIIYDGSRWNIEI